MINWMKSILGIKPSQAPEEKTPPKKVAGGPAGKSAAKAPAKKATTNKQTKATLTKLTKAQIDDLAKAQLSIDLDRRKTKDALIKDYLAAQKK